MIHLSMPNLDKFTDNEVKQAIIDMFVELIRQINRELLQQSTTPSGGSCRVIEVDGDLYLAANATWRPNYVCPDTSKGAWFREDQSKHSYLICFHVSNDIVGKNYGGVGFWVAQPEANAVIGNWTYKFETTGGWERAWLVRESRDVDVKSGSKIILNG